MKIKLAFAAITLGTLALVGCQSTSTRHPSPAPVATADPCKEASKLPAYTVTLRDGGEVSTPSGEDLVREASMDGLNGADLTRACKAFISQYRNDHR